MKKEEAIKKLQKQKAEYLEEWINYSGVAEAYDMAIEALSEPKTIIRIDIPYESDKGLTTIFEDNEKIVLEKVKEFISVVQCKDCKYQNECEEVILFDINDNEVTGHRVYWCSYGRSKNDKERSDYNSR